MATTRTVLSSNHTCPAPPMEPTSANQRPLSSPSSSRSEIFLVLPFSVLEQNLEGAVKFMTKGEHANSHSTSLLLGTADHNSCEEPHNCSLCSRNFHICSPKRTFSLTLAEGSPILVHRGCRPAGFPSISSQLTAGYLFQVCSTICSTEHTWSR